MLLDYKKKRRKKKKKTTKKWIDYVFVWKREKDKERQRQRGDKETQRRVSLRTGGGSLSF